MLGSTQGSVTIERGRVGGVGVGICVLMVYKREGQRGHMYTCGWYTLLYGKNQQNIIKQLSSN